MYKHSKITHGVHLQKYVFLQHICIDKVPKCGLVSFCQSGYNFLFLVSASELGRACN